MAVDFDFILETIGNLGRSQMIMVAAIYYFIVTSGMNTMQPVFTFYSPAFRCNVPKLENCSFNSFYDGLKTTLPSCEDKKNCDACKRMDIELDTWSCNMSHVNSSTVKTTDCEFGYTYDDTLFSSTAVMEFNLVCNRSIFKAIATSCFMLGILLGVITFGYISDRIGRRPSLIIAAYGCYIVMIGAAFAKQYWLYTLFRVLISFFLYGSKVCAFVFVMEISGNKYRTLIGLFFQVVFGIGYITLSGLSYRWRDWHHLQFACIVFSLPYAVMVLFFPESPRWLLSKARIKKAKQIIFRMARLNKKPLTEKDWEEAEESLLHKESIREKKNRVDDRKYSTIDLFRTRGICVITLSIMFNWFVNSFVYYGMSLNVGSLSGNIFINNVLGGIVDIASNFVCLATMDRFGRRVVISALLCMAGVALLICSVLNEISDTGAINIISQIFGLIGKLGISGSYSVIYNYTSELFPTVVRANGVGVGSAAARVGGMLAPFIIIVQDHVRWLPNVIFGVFSVTAGILSLRFPETMKIELIETIEEAESFYKRKYGRDEAKKEVVHKI